MKKLLSREAASNESSFYMHMKQSIRFVDDEISWRTNFKSAMKLKFHAWLGRISLKYVQIVHAIDKTRSRSLFSQLCRIVITFNDGRSDGKAINSRGSQSHGSDLRASHVTVIYSGYFIGSHSSGAREYGRTESRVNLLIANSAVISGNNELIHFFTILRYPLWSRNASCNKPFMQLIYYY